MLGKTTVSTVRDGNDIRNDSGFIEIQQSRRSSSDYLITPQQSGDLDIDLGDGDSKTFRCGRLSTDLITPQMSVSDKGNLKGSRMTGSSCQALRHAVAALNRLDDFTCEKIGSGFFSEVFKVTHKTTGQVMVLKMNLLRSNRPNMLKEVQLMNQLSHPHILGFMGVCVHEGQLHALTEYINGGSLEQLNLNCSLELPHRTRMKLALDIALGMEYLHSRGVFHRDLTSKNVLIKSNEEKVEMIAVVGDFGLAAKIPDPKSGYRLPTVGSPYWMSPECLKGQWYDEKSDVFSYGIVLCELIARCEADPDILPRTENFGLDYLAFADMCGPCPPEFLKLAFLCCTFEPKSRPCFTEIVKSLQKIICEYDAAIEMQQMQLNAATTKPIPEETKVSKMAASIGARSEEVLLNLSGAVESKDSVYHKKLCHRRSLSEDVGSIVFPPHTAPSDKARCHVMVPRPLPVGLLLPGKQVGESMLTQDPHYKPTCDKANPFAALSQFRGVKKILGAPNKGLSPSSFVQGVCGDLFSSCFELPSPFFNSPEAAESTRRSSKCKVALGFCEEDTTKTLKAELVQSSLSCTNTRVINKPMSLPGSPTLIRRRLLTSKTQPEKEDAKLKSNPHGSLFTHPLFTQRSCSSNLNLADTGLLLNDDPVLKRRGSCESGFFSSIGEDFTGTNDLLSPEFGINSRTRIHNTSSATLSSSSAASSLFLLDDPVVRDLDDSQSQGAICRPHHSLLFNAKRSSSIYTDSSEDISSLGGSDLYWEGNPSSQSGNLSSQPQQISKIVEYFERKQNSSNFPKRDILDSDVWEFQASRVQREMLFRSLGASLSNKVVPVVPTNQAAAPNQEKRLMICEGAVKSKLPLFDKK